MDNYRISYTSEYDEVRMDWRSMFVFDPAKRLMRLIGTAEQRAQYAKVMWERKGRYRAWMASYGDRATPPLYFPEGFCKNVP